MKKLLVVLLALSLTGCAARTLTSQTDFLVNGQNYVATTVTTRDRTGTDLHNQFVMDKDNKIVTEAKASGRGIVAGMTDGTVPAIFQGAAMVGAAAVWPADTYNNNSSGGISASGSHEI